MIVRKAIPKNLRDSVKRKYDGRCGYCGDNPPALQIDHIHPVSHGGNDALENLMPSCFSCNNYKLNRSLEQFRGDLSQQVYRARQYSINFRLAERFRQIESKESPIVFYFETQASK